MASTTAPGAAGSGGNSCSGRVPLRMQLGARQFLGHRAGVAPRVAAAQVQVALLGAHVGAELAVERDDLGGGFTGRRDEPEPAVVPVEIPRHRQRGE